MTDEEYKKIYDDFSKYMNKPQNGSFSDSKESLLSKGGKNYGKTEKRNKARNV